MQKRKYAILAAAALGAAPVLSQAAPTVSFTYDPTTVAFATSAAALATAVPTVIVNNTVTVPTGDYFEFGVDVTVTGNANPALTTSYTTPQPANLGIAGFGFAFNTSNPSELSAYQNSSGTSRAIVSGSFGTTGSGDVSADGNVGEDGAYLSGGNNANVGGTANNDALLTIGAAGAAQVFTHLIYKAGSVSGTATITPIIPAGAVALVYDKTAGSTSAAPTYGSSTAGFTTTNLPALTVNVGPLITTSPVTNKIVSLTAGAGAAPTAYGNSLGTLTVTNAGGPGKYFPGYFNVSGGSSKGFVTVAGFLPNDYPEIYAMQVTVGGATPTSSQISAIIADINANDSGVASASTVAGSAYSTIFPGYQILITDTSVDPYFAFDFTSDADTDSALGSVVVTSLAAVPEPATAAGIILGASGLLLGRRNKKQVTVA